MGTQEERRRRVLLVDDEVDLCLLMKTYFLRKNWEVFISRHFAAALSCAKDVQPNFVYLSEIDGLPMAEAVRRIREVAPDADVKSIRDINPKIDL